MAALSHASLAPWKSKTVIVPLDATIGRAKGAVAETAARGIGRTASTEIMVSDRIERPWALMRHHAGWADAVSYTHLTLPTKRIV